jgi:indolepyruvate ferredoxin oxidoreductase alpha subunit
VTGGALIIVGEDYGEGSSIMQERSHAFAMKSQIWLLDPRPNLPSIVAAVKTGFELSEASRTPVMLQLRIRACHVHGHFLASDNRRPDFTLSQALENPGATCPGSCFRLPASLTSRRRSRIAGRQPVRFIEEHGLNEFFSEEAATSASLSRAAATTRS